MTSESGQGTKVALITGAAGTLGRAAAKRLAETGYQIVAVDRDREGLRGLADLLGSALCNSIVADVADDGSTADYVEQAVKSAPGRSRRASNPWPPWLDERSRAWAEGRARRQRRPASPIFDLNRRTAQASWWWRLRSKSCSIPPSSHPRRTSIYSNGPPP